MAKLQIKKPNSQRSDKALAVNLVTAEDDYLSGQATNGRFDLDKRIHKSLKSLANATETEQGKSVSMRMLLTEALLDLFTKYEKGEGKYQFDIDEEWNWKG